MKSTKQKTEAEGRRRARRAREREARVMAICEAASRLFAERGVEVTTMEEVADEAALGKATLYHYFPTKQALYAEIVLRAADELAAFAEEVPPPSTGQTGASVTALDRFSRAYFSDAATLPRIMLPLMAGGRSQVRRELGPKVAARVAAAHAPIYEHLRLLEGRLGTSGALRELLITLLIGLAVRVRADPKHDVEPELELFFTLLRLGCQASKAASP